MSAKATPEQVALTSCPNCLETQNGPLASEYVSEYGGDGRVRHF